MKPSAGLFDGTARVWSPTETRSTIGGVEKSWAGGAEFDCAVQVSRRNQGNLGPGEADVGQWMVYSPADAVALAAGQVVEVLTGPEAGRTLYVDDPYKPRGRFQQTQCRQWDGDLPLDELQVYGMVSDSTSDTEDWGMVTAAVDDSSDYGGL